MVPLDTRFVLDLQQLALSGSSFHPQNNSIKIKFTGLFLHYCFFFHSVFTSLFTLSLLHRLPKRDISPTERTQKAITYFLDHWREFGFGTWIVIEKESGKLVGHCGLNVIKDTDEIEVLYALGPQHWGKGYATEAAKASLEFGFSSDVEWNGQKIEKIMAVALPDNKGSRKVMEKIGLRYVKDANYFGLDVVYYEITKAEFEKTK